MAQLIARLARPAPTETAIASEHARRTWAELDRAVNTWVDVFRRHGLGPGDRVAFVTGNRIVTFEALLACLHAGLVAVPISWRLTAAEIAYLLADSGSRALIVERAYAGRAAEAMRRAGVRPALGTVVDPGDGRTDGRLDGLVPAGELLADASADEPPGQCCGSVMLYTSATTGRPKGVVTGLFSPGADLDRAHRTIRAVGATFGIAERGRALLVGPWYHAAQAFFSLFPLLRGGTLVLRQRFDAASALADLVRHHITMCHLVPTQFVRLLALDDHLRARLAPTQLTRVWHGGAPCPIPVKRRMLEWWGPVLTEYYAATEAGIVTTIGAAEWSERPGSVGRPASGVEVVILGDGDQPVPAGHTGAVYIRRPPEMDFEYHNEPDKTAQAHVAPGTFTVGDLGYLDRDGYLYLTGRRHDTIISGGVNIYPAEVEAALLGHRSVRDAAVFGVPDEEFGERVMAVLELVAPADRAVDEVLAALDAHCREHLADFKRPRTYRVVSALPREPTGKLNRRALCERYGGR
jgi:long-chain acyl-CoA synthetase